MVDNTNCILQQQEEEDLFFNSREEISSISGSSCPGSSSNDDSSPEESCLRWVADDPRYKVWISSPSSIQERRARFMRWMGLDPIQSPVEESEPIGPDIDRIMSDGGAVLMSSALESSSSTSRWMNEEPSTSGDRDSKDRFEFRIKNLDDGSVSVTDDFASDGMRRLREVGSNRCMTVDEFDRSFGPSSFVQKLMQRDDNTLKNADNERRRKNKWLKRLGSATCIVDRQLVEVDPSLSHSSKTVKVSYRTQRVKVHSRRKRSKEFSAVYMGQDIKAHDGAIVTMKFSPDGEYLASAGEDCVVRVWRAMECERREEGDIPDDDPSSLYFKVNYNSELAPLFVDKEKLKTRSMKRTSDSACVIIPPEAFRISEEPVHAFNGHEGEVLDISWSKDKYLLSSSVDKTVRLWKVGCNDCLKVFLHNNYVTCVQFNPVDENYFVSGSIDGKVRVWEAREHRVVDWTDVRDIVTALCYRLDGKGIVVGTMPGNCRFYDASDHQLQFDYQISLQSKKKSLDKRITGFQYCPSDPRKLLVTSADSQIRILDGADVISKYKGLHNAGSQIAASFTPDGRHIVSASEDSHVYVWNHSDDPSYTTWNHVKSNRSYERFSSSHASVAVPWHGPLSRKLASEVLQGNCLDSLGDSSDTIYLPPRGSFTLSHTFLSEYLPKGTATWPEEKLPSSSRVTAPPLCKSQSKFLKTSCRNSSHAWGQVIVTAGWDGRIRSFQNYGLPVNQ